MATCFYMHALRTSLNVAMVKTLTVGLLINYIES